MFALVLATLVSALGGNGTAAAAPPAYAVTATVPVSDAFSGLAVDPVRHAVYLGTATGLTVLDTRTNAVTNQFALGSSTQAVTVDPTTHTVYLVNNDSEVVAVDPGTGQTVARIAAPGAVGTPGTPDLAIDNTTHTLVVGTWATDLTVIDTTTNTQRARIPVAEVGQGFGSGAVAVDPTTHLVYALTTAGAQVVDLTTASVVAAVPVAYGAFAFGPTRLVVDPAGHTLFAVGGNSDGVTVIDTRTNTVRSQLVTSVPPVLLGFDPARRVLFSTNFLSSALTVTDAATATETATVPLLGGADGGSGPIAVDPTTGAVYVEAFTQNTISLVVLNGPPTAPSCTGVVGLIGAKYAELGGCAGPLGKPTSLEQDAADGGKVTHFTNGDIYFTPATGAHAVQGAIAARYRSLGAENSRFGYPTTDELNIIIGKASVFQHGFIFFSPLTGAVPIPF